MLKNLTFCAIILLVFPLFSQTNVALDQPVTVSSAIDPYVGSMAVDEDISPGSDLSRWVAEPGFPQWIEIDLGRTYEVSSMEVYSGDGQGATYEDAVQFIFEYWDGEWLPVFSAVNNTNPNFYYPFDPVVSSKVRLYITGVHNSNQASVHGIKVNGKDIYLEHQNFWEIGVGNSVYNNSLIERIGIGTDDPQYELDVNGALSATQLLKNGYPLIQWEKNGNDLVYTGEGKVGIGTAVADKLLTINGNIHASDVTVQTTIPGPDYVFSSGYDLPTLIETEAFIKKEGHLPYFPAASQMEEEGMSSGEFHLSLLRTMEEMILHQMELKHRIDTLRIRNEIMRKSLDAKSKGK